MNSFYTLYSVSGRGDMDRDYNWSGCHPGHLPAAGSIHQEKVEQDGQTRHRAKYPDQTVLGNPGRSPQFHQ